MQKSKLITALYRILATGTEIVAWDFPSRSYKKAVENIISFLKKNNIPAERTIADWPHFTIAYVPKLSEEQRHKIKLLSPLYNTRIKTEDLIVLVGEKFPKLYLAWSLSFDNPQLVKALLEDINQIANTTQKFPFKPHVSLVMIDKKYQDDIESLLPEIYEIIKKYKIAYNAEQVMLWENMSVYDIESMKLR